ncbi:hypothetical protein B0H13DRAFT_1904077 [Mycena leptocephala]|nr:hypothetical protein B0H13DRAFT_1904077 [Mycena leptocephala]
MWLRWAVDPASALRVLLLPLLLAFPTHFLLPLLHLYLPASLQPPRHSQPLHPLPPLPPHTRSRALVDSGGLYLKGPGDLALLAYSIVLFSFLRLVLSHSLFPILARLWGIRKVGTVARFEEQGSAVVYFWWWGLGGTPSPPPPPPTRSTLPSRISGSTILITTSPAQ